MEASIHVFLCNLVISKNATFAPANNQNNGFFSVTSAVWQNLKLWQNNVSYVKKHYFDVFVIPVKVIICLN